MTDPGPWTIVIYISCVSSHSMLRQTTEHRYPTLTYYGTRHQVVERTLTRPKASAAMFWLSTPQTSLYMVNKCSLCSTCKFLLRPLATISISGWRHLYQITITVRSKLYTRRNLRWAENVEALKINCLKFYLY